VPRDEEETAEADAPIVDEDDLLRDGDAPDNLDPKAEAKLHRDTEAVSKPLQASPVTDWEFSLERFWLFITVHRKL
jgi:hypothetical protein